MKRPLIICVIILSLVLGVTGLSQEISHGFVATPIPECAFSVSRFGIGYFKPASGDPVYVLT